MRSRHSALAATYPPPTFAFEEDFAEEDPLWSPDVRETKAHIVERATSVLEHAFAADATCELFIQSWMLLTEADGVNTDISITAHGGFINGFLSAIGRPFYSLPTGGESPS